MHITVNYELYGAAWRVFNAIFALVGFVLVAMWIAPYWKLFRPRRRIIFMVLLLSQMNTAYGSLEQMSQGVPIGLRTFISTMTVVILFVGMVKFPDELPHESRLRPRR